jgi:hypothetical protein
MIIQVFCSLIQSSPSPGYENMVTKMITWGPSSKSYSSGDYRTFQLGDPIYDDRYVANRATDTRGPPIQLYNPVFACFLDDIANNDLEVPPLVIRATARLVDCSSAIYDNEDSDQRRRAIRADLTDAISQLCLNSLILTTTRWTGP